VIGLLKTLSINKQDKKLIQNVLDSLKLLMNFNDCAALLEEMNASQTLEELLTDSNCTSEAAAKV
jgi:hypothetical protein